MKQVIEVVDSHTGGEPTRTVIAGGPDLGTGSLAQRRDVFKESFDNYRRAIVNEPRGSDILVGALLCEPSDPQNAAGVIFFNNVGYLNMCGHGAIGVAETLRYLGRIDPGEHRLETPVGVITLVLEGPNQTAIENVPSYRYRKDVRVEVAGYGQVIGDIAWGGNWFFLIDDHGLELSLQHHDNLMAYTVAVKTALQRSGITGENGHEIDHIELIGPPQNPENHGRNFVLCPGLAYDRSPCGTGTSAKLACLAADGHLEEEQPWRQESIIGSVFTGSYRQDGECIIPRIQGSAYVNARSMLMFDPAAPFAMGIQT